MEKETAKEVASDNPQTSAITTDSTQKPDHPSPNPSTVDTLVSHFSMQGFNTSLTQTLLMQSANSPASEAYFLPCDNFSMVCKGVYRSAFPKKKNFEFLKKLGLKSILTLILEEYPDLNKRFLEKNKITLFQFGVAGNKEPFVDIPEDTICKALSVILDKRNHPLLIHCNKGKHRTGCLVGCLRKLQHWSYTSIFDEYRRFSHPKSRSMDQQFIELFDASQVEWPKHRAHWPDWPEIAHDFVLTETESSFTSSPPASSLSLSTGLDASLNASKSESTTGSRSQRAEEDTLFY